VNGPRKVHVLVEGHGEVQAVGNLLSRLSEGLGLQLIWRSPRRWKNLHRESGLERAAEYVRWRSGVSSDGLLVLRDEDDACPRERGPEMAGWLRRLDLPIPAAVVLLHPE